MKQITIPDSGIKKDELISQLNSMKSEDVDWKNGRLFTLIYNAGEDVIDIAQTAYNTYFMENGLSAFAFPSLKKMETETISMTASLLGGDEKIVGSMTSGGSESILMAVKTARDYARDKKPHIKNPEIITPTTAHPAFDRAAHYLNLKIIHIPVDDNFKADISVLKKAINENTIMIAGSAPTYPHGMIDPIHEMVDTVKDKDIWVHVDACLGGFILPFVKRLGYNIPQFDFTVPGVYSMSADLHKYAFCPKGASTVLYRNKNLRHYQIFAFADWPGGVYGTPTISGARPGGAIAAAWAVLNYLGIQGYKSFVKQAMETAKDLMNKISSIPELKIIGNPDATIFAFSSDSINIYELAQIMKQKYWHLEAQHLPPCIHMTVSPVHSKIIDEFVEDLSNAVKEASKIDEAKVSQAAAMYGMMGTLPDRKAAKEMAVSYINDLYKL